MSYDELDDLFSGGGSPAVKFTKIGDAVTGVITATEVRSQRDFDSGEVLTWDDGKEKKELVLTISTTLRDATIEDDDGTRRVFCRGQMLTAMRDAVRKAKAPKPEIGGKVTITHTEVGEPKKRGYNGPKLFAVTYEPPAAVAVTEMFDEPDTAAPAAPAASSEDLMAQAANLDPAALQAMLAQLAAAQK